MARRPKYLGRLCSWGTPPVSQFTHCESGRPHRVSPPWSAALSPQSQWEGRWLVCPHPAWGRSRDLPSSVYGAWIPGWDLGEMMIGRQSGQATRWAGASLRGCPVDWARKPSVDQSRVFVPQDPNPRSMERRGEAGAVTLALRANPKTRALARPESLLLSLQVPPATSPALVLPASYAPFWPHLSPALCV